MHKGSKQDWRRTFLKLLLLHPTDAVLIYGNMYCLSGQHFCRHVTQGCHFEIENPSYSDKEKTVVNLKSLVRKSGKKR